MGTDLLALEKQNLFNKKILITGTARNVSRHIRKILKVINKALETFNYVQWLVIESDSDDNSVQILDELTKSHTYFRYISLGKDLHTKIPCRVERILYARNAYLKEIRSNPLYKDTDYIVMADLDDVNVDLTAPAFLSCWQRDDWDVCTANQGIVYYDMFALRHEYLCPGDVFSKIRFMKTNGVTNLEKLTKYSVSYISIPQNAPWIEVDSAFGGLAVYKASAIGNTEYIVQYDAKGYIECEHVHFHKQIRDKGKRIFINPQLINSVLPGHSNHKRYTHPRIYMTFCMYFLLKDSFKSYLKSHFPGLLHSLKMIKRFLYSRKK